MTTSETQPTPAPPHTAEPAVRLHGLTKVFGKEKVVDALGFDPAEEGLHIVSPIVDDDIMHTAEMAIHEHRLLELEYWTQSQDRYSERVVEPYGRINSREGWYIDDLTVQGCGVVNQLFQDGFESGNLLLWSGSNP